MSQTRTLGAVAALVIVFVLAACGGPDSKYVSNEKAGLFLKIPTKWQTVQLQVGDVMPDGLLAAPEVWRVGIDGAAQPRRSDFETNDSSEPNGLVEVIPIDPSKLTSSPSLAMLRELVTGPTTDPNTGQQLTPTVNIIRDDEVTMSSGYWGLRTTVESMGDQPVRLEQLAMFDPGVHRLYRVTVNCTSSCFDAHADDIESIFDSLTLRGTS
jgi:hypothetical protein